MQSDNTIIHHQSRNYKNISLFIGLLLGSLFISFLIATQGITMGVLALAILIGLPLLSKALVDLEFGFYLLIWYSYFLFYLGRLLPVKLPMGIGVELIEIILLLGILFMEMKRKKTDWSNFNNPVTYLLALFQIYTILQVFNPNAISLAGWLASTRGMVFDIVAYFILVKILSSVEIVKKFTRLWLFLALLAALYSIYQEAFGYREFEWRDIYSNPQTITLIQNWGILRKFSFLSDVATFGILMAVAGVFCIVLSLGKFHIRTKIILWVSALFMFVGMSLSGTRTATVVIPIGLIMYVLMHINNRNTLILLFVGVIGFGAIMFGPFYGGIILRVRTAFQPSKDASMNVREINRARAQPYIHEHPIGGGLNTTDGEGELLAPGHILAGFPTDSGYLKVALTMGWIGLILQMALFFTVIAIGVKNFYAAKNPQVKAIYSAYICLFFALLIANYAQPALWQKPTGLIVFSIFVIMPNLIKYDSPLENDDTVKLSR